jgi:CRISPR-associated protein (TIGR03986 family)
MRDLSPHNKDYTIKQNLNKVKAGFLISIKGNYYLIESPEYERIYYKEFDELLNEERIGEQIQKSSKVSQKYKLARNKLFYEYDDDSKWAVVLTGKMFNKKAEYGFMFPKTINPKKVPDNVIKNFMFVYEKETYSDTWKFWKKKIKNFSSEPTIGELTKEICWVPVFYMNNNNNEEICHLGLTFLYREPFPNSIHSLIPKNHANNKVLDFAEALFGLANKENMLRGRVAFSNGHFENYEEDTVREIVLGSPKPTFFPFYLVQDKNKPFTTFSNSEAKINGWKRYIPHKYVSDTNFTNDNANVRTRIKPIKSGGTFQIVIHFHNLKSVELGALLSALTFHNNYENCFHLIGMGKPLGYGKVKVQEIAIDKADTDITTHMANFESYICDKMFGGNFEQWKNAVLKLFSYAMENSAGKEIRYPKAFDEFKAIKKQKLNITDFSPDNTNFKLKSLKQTKI